MDQSLISRMKQRPLLLSASIAAITICVLALNGYGMVFLYLSGVLPHLFYIPIILTAYFFPRRGVLFACLLSLAYFSMNLLIAIRSPLEIVLTLGRILVFILIAAVVSFLTLRLQESEQQYRGVAERSSDILLLTDTEGKTTYVSPSFGKILGIGRTVILERRPDDFIHPDDMPALQREFFNLLHGKPFAQFTARTRNKNGEYLFIEYAGTPVFTNGVCSGIQVIGRDVTEHMKVEDAYRETSRRMAEIIEFLPDPTMAVDRSGAVVAWNQAMEAMSGLAASEVMGKGEKVFTGWISDSYHPVLIVSVLHRDTDAIRAVYPHVHVDGDTIRTETAITRRDGTRFSLWVSATPLVGKDGEITGAIESLRDVTHQKKIERALKESNTFLDAIINAMADPFFIKDHDHRYIKINDRFCLFTGYTRDAILGKRDSELFGENEASSYQEIDDGVFRSGLESENEETVTDAAGFTRTVVTKKTLYTNASGEQFIVGVIRDITERKKTERALQQALKKLNMLSSITRHDILNQLMSLRGYLSLAKEREEDPELLGYLEREERAAESIQRQIEFTRNYENLGVTVPQWQDVDDLFRSAAAQLPLGKIAVDVQVSGISVYADPLIAKVFYNLIENSLRHGGTITTIGLSAAECSGNLILTYRDNGTGIADSDRMKLFQKGFGKHTGLGLFLSREILSITGITIEETGAQGSGARFEIRIPKGAYRTGSQE